MTFIIFLAVVLLAFFTELSPVIFVVASAILGIVIKNVGGKKA